MGQTFSILFSLCGHNYCIKRGDKMGHSHERKDKNGLPLRKVAGLGKKKPPPTPEEIERRASLRDGKIKLKG